MLGLGQNSIKIPQQPQNPLPEPPAARQGQSLGQHQGPELQKLGAAKLFIHSHQIQWLLPIQDAFVCMELHCELLFSLRKV